MLSGMLVQPETIGVVIIFSDEMGLAIVAALYDM